MLQETETSSRLRSALLVVLVAVVGVVPYRVTAHSEAAAAPPAAASAPSTVSEVPPETDQDFGYAWINNDKTLIQNMSTDSHAARRLSQHGEPVLLVRQKGQAYVIRDPATLSQTSIAVAPIFNSVRDRQALTEQRIRVTEARNALAAARMELIDTDPADRKAMEHALSGKQVALQKEQAVVDKQEAIMRGKNAADARSEATIKRLAEQAIASHKATPITLPASTTKPAPPAPPAPPALPPAPPRPPAGPLPPAPPGPPPAPPAPPVPPHNMAFSGHGHSHIDIDTDSDARNGFALFDGDSVTMNGTSRDIATAQHLRRGNESLLWVRRDGKSYVIRDAATLARAKAIYAPVSTLGEAQGKLGGRQGELGGRQGALGARQGALGQQQAQLAMERAALIGQRNEEARSAELDARQKTLEARQAELGRQQEALGRQQEVLGKQQEALGRKQQQASEKASREMGALIDDALTKGTAQAVSMR